MNEQSGIKWCTLEQLGHETCHDYLSWAIDGVGSGINDISVKWLLAHCHDGVTWGLLGDDNSWQLSSMFFPNLSPCISASNLLELRMFGVDGEFLIWQTENGFVGRSLADQKLPMTAVQDSCRPDNETRILLGNKFVESQDRFTHVRTARGTQQAVPLECTKDDFTGDRWPLRLEVRHYFEENRQTGVVRVGASRLVNVFKKGV